MKVVLKDNVTEWLVDSWPEKVTFELRNERYEEFNQEESYRKSIPSRGNHSFKGPLGTENQAEGAALRQNIRDRIKRDGNTYIS